MLPGEKHDGVSASHCSANVGLHVQAGLPALLLAVADLLLMRCMLLYSDPVTVLVEFMQYGCAHKRAHMHAAISSSAANFDAQS